MTQPEQEEIATHLGLIASDTYIRSIDPEEPPDYFWDHPGQLAVWNAHERFIAAFAGWQSGKTTVGPHWLLREMSRCGPGDYAVIAPTKPMLMNKAVPELLKVFRKLIKTSGDEWFITEAGAREIWGFVPDEPARILLRHGKDPNAIEAFTAKGIWVDEPGQIPDLVWEAIQARASIHLARILLTSRPYEHNWYVKDFWNKVMEEVSPGRWERKADAPPYKAVINFTSIDNPSFPKEEYERKEREMPPWKFTMKYKGIPTRPAGAVYENFDEKIHTCPRFRIPNEWPRYLGVDFGPKHTSGTFLAHDVENDLYYLYRTYLKGDIPVLKTDPADEDGHIDNFRKMEPTDIHGTVIDPFAAGGAASENEWRSDFAMHGFDIHKPRVSSLEVGIQAVYELFAKGRIRIFNDLVYIIEEIKNYAYEIDDLGEALTDREPKDKAKYHRLDGLRYIAVSLKHGVDEGPQVYTRKGGKPENETQRRDRDDRDWDDPSPFGDDRPDRSTRGQRERSISRTSSRTRGLRS